MAPPHAMFRKYLPLGLLISLIACDEKVDPTATGASASAPAASTASLPPVPDAPSEPFRALAETVADHQVLRYQVPGFDELSAKQKELAYYLYQAALAGRDITYDQNCAYNLVVRRTLDAIVQSYPDKASEEYRAALAYAKQVWIHNGIHHSYSSAKIEPGFDKAALEKLVKGADAKLLPLDPWPGSTDKPDAAALTEKLAEVLFDKEKLPVRVNRKAGVDLLKTSANNFYEGVTQKEAEAHYAKLKDPKDLKPISWGLNSKLVKEDGKLVERTWKVGGMYGAALEKIVSWLEKAVTVAENDKQKTALELLIKYYKSGDLKDFDDYSVAWVKDTDSRLDVVNGFIESYGDPLGYRATFESVVSLKDMVRSKRIGTIAGAAQWFEDNSPIAKEHKKEKVVGISAKVITVIVESGDAAPTTPVGINLPNADWIRKDAGSKSVFLGNVMDAYDEASKNSGVLDEFAASPEEIKLAKEHGTEGSNLKVDMHEVIGHASGQLEAGVSSEALKNYGSALEEARADLVALYYVMDKKLVELGVMKSLDVGKAGYDSYVRNGLLVQLARVKLGSNIEQSHMRNRAMICWWAYEKGKDKNVIEKLEKDGKTYFVIKDYDALRALWGELLKEIQRIKSQGDFAAGKKLIETYGVKVDRKLHEEVLERYSKLPARPFGAFIQPKLVATETDGKVSNVTVSYPKDFSAQMLEYGREHSFLPTFN
ncbi:MAG: hypothetical protein R3B13_09100 [Polyangiaceae bacterium]